MQNHVIADRLREAAELLEQQGADRFRVGAYRRGAATIVGLGEDSSELLQRAGRAGLEALPGIGRSLATAIAEMATTGRWAQLERLRGAVAPEALFQSIPGVGPELAKRLHDELHVDTLEALEVAAHDGRLEQVKGIGERRAAALRATLAAMLNRTRRTPHGPASEPGVEVLLDVDAEYRRRAATGELPQIAPRRFNPTGAAWLPILHTERGPWQVTALFSNTARAHELERTADWVVVYFQGDDHEEGQRTIVTETRGRLQGQRVVRGREAECLSRLPEVLRAGRRGAGAA